MPYIYKVVEGEQAMLDLLRRMGKLGKDETPRFVESYAHVDNITIERNLYARYKDESRFRHFIILYMPSEKGTMCCMSDIRKKVYEEIRTSNAPR